jgi:hypothetical protein
MWLRLPSAVFATATAVVLHAWLSRRFGHLVALVAVVGALFLSDEFHFYISEARPYTLYMLAATLQLVAADRLVRDESAGRRAWWQNAAAAALLPSVHYTGLIFSGTLLLAVVVAGPASSAFRKSVAGSFAVGWAIFAAVHAKQITLILASGAAVWISRPTVRDAMYQMFSQITLPGIVVMTCLAAIVVGTIRAAPTPNLGGFPADRTDRFYCWAAAAWLITPVLIYILAAVGLPNMAIPRYVLPHRLAVGILSALVLSPFIRSSEDRASSRSTAMVSATMVSSVVLAIVVNAHFARWFFDGLRMVTAFRGSNELWMESRYEGIRESDLLTVTNDSEIFFQYAYLNGGSGNLRLLVNTSSDVEMYRSFDPALGAVTPIDLVGMDEFWFVPLPSPEESDAPSAPARFAPFDIRSWCRDNGCSVDETKMFGSPIGSREGFRIVKSRTDGSSEKITR